MGKGRDWSKRDKLFLEENADLMTERELALALGRTTDAIKAKKLAMGLTNSKYKMGGTICYNCRHAYADDCFGVPPEDREWVKDFIEHTYEVQERQITCRKVKSCDRHEVGRKPLGIYGLYEITGVGA